MPSLPPRSRNHHAPQRAFETAQAAGSERNVSTELKPQTCQTNFQGSPTIRSPQWEEPPYKLTVRHLLFPARPSTSQHQKQKHGIPKPPPTSPPDAALSSNPPPT
ncbi:hypothetical protein CVT26_008848 [Gymnopilus dilepis]|uniref:Uncharacterized protein n=1 Tax=Gymnopilus dilepis TaxID=231916 RepID=A0A409YGJ4_9AGAR|nr:hypothetical protein CVT26_008848 [Gymnopilus dilepis]